MRTSNRFRSGISGAGLRWAVLILLAASGCQPAPGPTEDADIATAAVPSATRSPERATVAPATDTPVVQSTVTPTATPPEVTFTKNAFCRQGPGTYYNIQTAFDLGATSLIEGKNEDATWWLITDPESPQACWVSAATVETSASPDRIEVMSAPPLPDPVEGFYLDDFDCDVSNKKYTLVLWWLDGEGELGYRLYRNGDELRPLRVDSDHFIDDDAPLFEELLYELEAYNKYGASERRYVETPACQ